MFITPVDNEQLKEALEGVKKGVQGEREDELFYDYLISVAPNTEDREVIESIRNDERKHNKYFRTIYRYYTGMEITNDEDENIDFEKPSSYLDGIKRALFGELRAVEKYREISKNLPNGTFKDVLFEIITDELKHASKYNYLLTNNMEANSGANTGANGGTNTGMSGGTNTGMSGGTNTGMSGGTNTGMSGGTNTGLGGTNTGMSGGANTGFGGTNTGMSSGANTGFGGTNTGMSGGANTGFGGTNTGMGGGANTGFGGTNTGMSGGANTGFGGTNTGMSGGANTGFGGTNTGMNAGTSPGLGGNMNTGLNGRTNTGMRVFPSSGIYREWNRNSMEDTSNFTPDDWVRYITPLVNRALTETNQGINQEHLYQEFILAGVLVGLGKTPKEAIEQVESWEKTGESQLLSKSKMMRGYFY